MYIALTVHRPSAGEITPLVSGEDNLPVGVRFGAPAALGQGELLVYLTYANYAHENQYVEAISACDQLIEVVNSIRSGALKRLAALKPNEEIVGFISDAEASQPAGWDGAGADVEAQRG